MQIAFHFEILIHVFWITNFIGLSKCDPWTNTTISWTAEYKPSSSPATLQLIANPHTIIDRFSKGLYKRKGSYHLKTTKDSDAWRLKLAVAYDQNGGRLFTNDLVTRKLCFVQNNSAHQCPFNLPLSSQIYSLSYDWVSGMIYWSDAYLKLIGVYGISRRVWKPLITRGLDGPLSIVAAPTIGCLFWSDVGESARIERSDMTGGKRVVIVKDSIASPSNLYYDIGLENLFWLDTSLERLCSCGVDGSDRKEYESTKYQKRFTSFVIAWPYVIFGTETNLLAFLIKNTTKLQYKTSITFKNYVKVKAMAISNPMLQPNIKTGCSNDNGACDQLCFRVKESARVCMCGVGFELGEDGTTCNSFFLNPFSKSHILILDSEGRIIEVDKLSGKQAIISAVPSIVTHMFYEAQKQILIYSSYSIIHVMDFKSNLSERIYTSDISNTVSGLAFDRSRNRVLFTTQRGQLTSMNLSGLHVQNHLTLKSPQIRLLRMDNEKRVLFIGDCFGMVVWKVAMVSLGKKEIFLKNYCVYALSYDEKRDLFYFVTKDALLYSSRHNVITLLRVVSASHNSDLNKILHFNPKTNFKSNLNKNFKSKLPSNQIHDSYTNQTSSHLFHLASHSNSSHIVPCSFTSVSNDDEFIYLTDVENHCVWGIEKVSMIAIQLNTFPINKPSHVVILNENCSGPKPWNLLILLPILLSFYHTSLNFSSIL